MLYLMRGDADELVVNTLQYMCDNQFAVRLPSNRYQLTELAMEKLMHVQTLEDFTNFLTPRTTLEIKDITTWEKLAMLEAHGWSMEVAKPRARVKPLNLESVEGEDKIFYVNSSKLDVSTLYLECLCSIPALLERGVLVISCHKL